VYRARDTKLGRDVAIKVLALAFAFDRDRLSRFEREARLLAALNHPHIASIYGFEEDPHGHIAPTAAPSSGLIIGMRKDRNQPRIARVLCDYVTRHDT
jgi:serine/threonine protein kinase